MSSNTLAESISTFGIPTGPRVDLVTRIEYLEDIIINLQDKITTLEATQDSQAENELNMLRLIADLRKKEPGKTEISRAEKIEKYLESRPDHKATFETLKGHLGINKQRLNEAIKTLMNSTPGRYGIIRTPGVKKGKTLKMLSR
jgi:hypothetical protein